MIKKLAFLFLVTVLLFSCPNPSEPGSQNSTSASNADKFISLEGSVTLTSGVDIDYNDLKVLQDLAISEINSDFSFSIVNLKGKYSLFSIIDKDDESPILYGYSDGSEENVSVNINSTLDSIAIMLFGLTDHEKDEIDLFMQYFRDHNSYSNLISELEANFNQNYHTALDSTVNNVFYTNFVQVYKEVNDDFEASRTIVSDNAIISRNINVSEFTSYDYVLDVREFDDNSIAVVNPKMIWYVGKIRNVENISYGSDLYEIKPKESLFKIESIIPSYVVNYTSPRETYIPLEDGHYRFYLHKGGDLLSIFDLDTMIGRASFLNMMLLVNSILDYVPNGKAAITPDLSSAPVLNASKAFITDALNLEGEASIKLREAIANEDSLAVMSLLLEYLSPDKLASYYMDLFTYDTAWAQTKELIVDQIGEFATSEELSVALRAKFKTAKNLLGIFGLILDVGHFATHTAPMLIDLVFSPDAQLFEIDVNNGTVITPIESVVPDDITDMDAEVVNSNTVSLDWDEVDGAQGYNIYVRSIFDPADTYELNHKIYSPISNTIMDVDYGDRTYYFKITSFNEAGESIGKKSGPVSFPDNSAPSGDFSVKGSFMTGSQLGLTTVDITDDQHDYIEYSWEIVSSPNNSICEIIDNDKGTAYFTPDKVGSYTIRLTYSDFMYTETSESTFSVSSSNDQTAPDTFILNHPPALGSNPNITFTWSGSDNLDFGYELVYSTFIDGYDSGWSDYSSDTLRHVSGIDYDSYTMNIRAMDKDGNVDLSPAQFPFVVEYIAPIPPSDFLVTDYSHDYIELSWTIDPDTLDFVIQRSLDNVNWDFLAEPGIDSSVFTDTAVEPSTLYYYRIRSQNYSGDSQFTESVSQMTDSGVLPLPGQVTGVDVALNPSETAIMIYWSEEAYFTSYEVWKSVNGGDYELLATPVSEQYFDSDFDYGNDYSYQVRAVNSTGNGEFSSVETLSIPPEIPDNFEVAIETTSAIYLSWDQSSNVTAYRLEYSSSSSGPFTLLALLDDTDDSYVHGESSGVTVYFRIQAGGDNGWSDYSTVISGTVR